MGESFHTLIALSLVMVVSAESQEVCVPACGEGFLCHLNQCISACNPPCSEGQICSSDGECLEAKALVTEPTPPKPVSVPKGERKGLSFKLLAVNGYTSVDIEEVSGYDTELSDWYQGNHGGVAQVFLKAGGVRLGLEGGFEHIYSWWADVPYGSYTLYYENTWWVPFGGLIGEFKFGPAYAGAGIGFHFLDVPVLGVSTHAGLVPKIGPVGIPLEIRVKNIFGDGAPTVIQLGIGILLNP